MAQPAESAVGENQLKLKCDPKDVKNNASNDANHDDFQSKSVCFSSINPQKSAPKNLLKPKICKSNVINYSKVPQHKIKDTHDKENADLLPINQNKDAIKNIKKLNIEEIDGKTQTVYAVKDIKNAIKKAVKLVVDSDADGKKSSKCNISTSNAFNFITGSDELKFKPANKMIEHMENNSDSFSAISMTEASKLADKGAVVFATFKTQSGSGHVSMLVPGESYSGGSGWKTRSESGKDVFIKQNLPKVMDTGSGRRSESINITECFASDKHQSVIFYVYNPKE